MVFVGEEASSGRVNNEHLQDVTLPGWTAAYAANDLKGGVYYAYPGGVFGPDLSHFCGTLG